jgi:hypothetical protein
MFVVLFSTNLQIYLLTKNSKPFKNKFAPLTAVFDALFWPFLTKK